jgi:predicted ATPase
MLTRTNDLVKENSQFIIATYSPIIMSYPAAKILELTEAGINETRLEDTNYYSIMKQFFDEKDRLIHTCYMIKGNVERNSNPSSPSTFPFC